MATIDLGKIQPLWRGEFSPTPLANYEPLDNLSYLNTVYISILESDGSFLPTNTTYFKPLIDLTTYKLQSLIAFVISQYAGGDATIVAPISAGLPLASYEWFVDTSTLQVFAKNGAIGAFSDPLDFDPTAGIDSGVTGVLLSVDNSANNEYTLYSGTADAIVLSTAYSSVRKSLRVGDQVRFTATANNTGATTINLDGLGAVSCLTIIGLVLPASYIRDDVETVATYDGTNWIVDRQIERGSNANGNYVRFADSTLLRSGDSASDPLAITSAADNVFFGTLPITFPVPSFDAATTTVEASVVATASVVWPNVNSITTTGCSLIAICNASKTVTTSFKWSSTATWYGV